MVIVIFPQMKKATRIVFGVPMSDVASATQQPPRTGRTRQRCNDSRTGTPPHASERRRARTQMHRWRHMSRRKLGFKRTWENTQRQQHHTREHTPRTTHNDFLRKQHTQIFAIPREPGDELELEFTFRCTTATRERPTLHRKARGHKKDGIPKATQT